MFQTKSSSFFVFKDICHRLDSIIKRKERNKSIRINK
jgi:hypothetical protein